MDAFLPGVGNWKDVWLLRDLWHFHFYGEVPLKLVAGRERIYFEHFWNDFAADRTRSVPEADRKLLRRGVRPARRHARGLRRTSRRFRRTRWTSRRSRRRSSPMPMLVLTGEKASGAFLIEQGRLVASDVRAS